MPHRKREDFGLSEADAQLLEYQDRYDQAWLSLGGTLSGRRIYRRVFLWVLDDVREWRLSSLATALDMPRNTLRACVVGGLKTGWIQSVSRHKYSGTSVGLDTFLEIQRQTGIIAAGAQQGYSVELLRQLGINPLMPVTEKAATISFPNTLDAMDYGILKRE